MALKVNLKLVNDWLGNHDFVSAAETAEELTILVSVYQYQSDQPAWRDKIAALREATGKLVKEAKAKNATACANAWELCSARLGELAQNSSAGERAVVKDFKPIGPSRPLMKLMGGTYAEAKAAKSAQDLSDMAYTIAELANVARYLRNEPAWDERAADMRDTALRVAAMSSESDLQSARVELKNVYQRCETCHQAYKR